MSSEFTDGLRNLARMTNDGYMRGPAIQAADRIDEAAATIAHLQAELAEARGVPGRIVEWLNERIHSAPKDQYSRGACDVFKLVACAIEARDWSKP